MAIKRFLPDTNVLIYGLMGEKPYASLLKKWIKQKTLSLSSIVVAEFWLGQLKKKKNFLKLFWISLAVYR
jgi:predicted nucleic acid-binding protein